MTATFSDASAITVSHHNGALSGNTITVPYNAVLTTFPNTAYPNTNISYPATPPYHYYNLGDSLVVTVRGINVTLTPDGRVEIPDGITADDLTQDVCVQIMKTHEAFIRESVMDILLKELRAIAIEVFPDDPYKQLMWPTKKWTELSSRPTP